MPQRCFEPRPAVPPPEPAAERMSFDAVFRQYAPYVGAIGLRLLGRRDEVDDLVQDVFLAAFRGLKQLREQRAIKAWLTTVTVRNARRRLRRRRLRTFLGIDSGQEYGELADTSASPELRATLARAYALLDRLPTDQRLVWTLRHVQGERLPVIALLCECSLATVKRRLSAATDTLEKALANERTHEQA